MSTIKIIMPACVLALSLANFAAAQDEPRPQPVSQSLLDSVSSSLAAKLEERDALRPGSEDDSPTPYATTPVTESAEAQARISVPDATPGAYGDRPRVARIDS